MGQAFQKVTCDLNTRKNNEEHRTNEICTQTLVVRRGQSFTIILHFGKTIKKYVKNLKKLSLIVQTGPKSHQVHHEFAITSLGDKKSWSAAVEHRSLLSWVLSITTPASANIGCYTLLLKVCTTLHTSVHKMGEFVLLFNPWCPADAVFLSNEAQRQEYVLNEDGLIYRGSENSIQPYPWNFGQGDEEVLNICLHLLDVPLQFMDPSRSDFVKRSDPVYISRIICAMLNCNDDKGIMFGKWSGDYEDGTAPGRWRDSLAILRQWFATGCQPVRYGHCWVFAAVMCTVLRCLGVPTRVVTNFTSAHDANGSLVVDEYYNEHGAKIKNGRNDSIWNFHVWNECWMKRKDLPVGYDGWQALDATPQEKEEGRFCCGPAPVKAIKEGDVDLNYDSAFFFAEVNADCAVWVYHSSGELEKVSCSTRYTGSSISTKSVGSDRCEDITHSYKFPEGSVDESKAFQEAQESYRKYHKSQENRRSYSTQHIVAEGISKLVITIESDTSIPFGHNIKFSTKVTNKYEVEMNLQLIVVVQSLLYNGVTQNQFWNEEFDISLLANEEKTITARLVYSQYRNLLRDNNLLRITALSRNKDNGSTSFAQQDVMVCKPSINIEMPTKAIKYNPVTATISFTNPLPEPLEECVLTVQGKGLVSNERTYRFRIMEPGGQLTQPIEFTPTQSGLRRLNLHMDCSKIQDIKGYRNLKVLAA